MTEQQHQTATITPEQALAALDQAWAYYTPEKQPEPSDHDYIDLPVAA